MDSKMEAMRALIENDRQVEGCFTTFNVALERPALKMDRFLNPPPPRAAAPAAPASEAAAEPQSKPDAPPAHAAFAPRPDSPFAGKLRQALQPAAPDQEK
jgi:hypothetical protein